MHLLRGFLPEPRTIDDAFITFRYSRNLLEGNGFVYNVGNRVLGTTTPLFTILMATIGGILGDDYPWYALFVNAIADSLSVGLLFLLGTYLTGNRFVGLLTGLIWGNLTL